MERFRDEVRRVGHKAEEDLHAFERELRKVGEGAEHDAEAVLREGPEVPEAPRWHHRWILFPLSSVWQFVRRNGKRVGVTIAGFALILVGIALLVLPGPGWLLIFAGLALLSTEYVWAQRMLNKAKQQAQKARDKVVEKKNARAERKAAKRDAASGSPTDA